MSVRGSSTRATLAAVDRDSVVGRIPRRSPRRDRRGRRWKARDTRPWSTAVSRIGTIIEPSCSQRWRPHRNCRDACESNRITVDHGDAVHEHCVVGRVPSRCDQVPAIGRRINEARRIVAERERAIAKSGHADATDLVWKQNQHPPPGTVCTALETTPSDGCEGGRSAGRRVQLQDRDTVGPASGGDHHTTVVPAPSPIDEVFGRAKGCLGSTVERDHRQLDSARGRRGAPSEEHPIACV